MSSERRPVPGFEGLYEVSADGRICSLPRLVRCKGGFRSVPAQEKSTTRLSVGYLQVHLYRNGKPTYRLAHRVVCEAFHGVAPGLQVNHKNGIRDDNRAENLEWVTASQNQWHASHVLGRKPPRAMLGRFGADNPGSKPVEAVDPATGAVVHRFAGGMEASRAGFHNSAIAACIVGRRQSHAGRVWRRAA